MKRFDIVLMNPPYSGSLHLKFLEKAIEISDKVVSIQPLTWVQNVFGDETGKKYILKYKISNIDFIGKIKDVFPQTDKKATYDVGIIYCDKNSKINKDLLYEFIELYPGQRIDPILIKSIKEKILNFCKENNLEDNIKSGQILEDSKYCLIIPKLLGNVGEKTDRMFWENSPRWGRIFYKGKSEGKTPSEYKKKLRNVVNYSDFDYLEFDSEIEAKNWINTQKTDFMRFVTILNSVDSNRRSKFIPFMKDYTIKWTNDKFCEYFNITDEEKKQIHYYIKLYDNKFLNHRNIKEKE